MTEYVPTSEDLKALAKVLPSKGPVGIFFVLHAVLLLMKEEDTSWEAARTVLATRGHDVISTFFAPTIEELASTVIPKTVHGLAALVDHPDFGRGSPKLGGAGNSVLLVEAMTSRVRSLHQLLQQRIQVHKKKSAAQTA